MVTEQPVSLLGRECLGHVEVENWYLGDALDVQRELDVDFDGFTLALLRSNAFL